MPLQELAPNPRSGRVRRGRGRWPSACVRRPSEARCQIVAVSTRCPARQPRREPAFERRRKLGGQLARLARPRTTTTPRRGTAAPLSARAASIDAKSRLAEAQQTVGPRHSASERLDGVIELVVGPPAAVVGRRFGVLGAPPTARRSAASSSRAGSSRRELGAPDAGSRPRSPEASAGADPAGSAAFSPACGAMEQGNGRRWGCPGDAEGGHGCEEAGEHAKTLAPCPATAAVGPKLRAEAKI